MSSHLSKSVVPFRSEAKALLGSVLLMLLSSACGAQAYQAVASSESQNAPGSYSIPPKVDILLAEDTTGSAYGDYTQIVQQFPTFLSTIENSNWNYHFAAVPLTTQETITQAFASKYDSNWGSQWISPYPGAQQWITGPGGQQELPAGNLSSSVFVEPNGSVGFPTPSNAGGGLEPGLQTIGYALNTGAQGTGLIRSDALLVVMVIGNGDDTSLVNLCTRSDGVQGVCEDMGAPSCTSGTALSNYKAGYATQNSNGTWPVCGTSQQSLSYYQSMYQGLKSSPSQFQFFAAVAAEEESNCIGSHSYVGSRYMNMAALTGGSNVDICSNSISSVLSQLQNNLQTIRASYHTDYLFVSQTPQVSTIVVTKYTGGSASQAVTIPQDANNGWTYAGQVNNVYAIDYPVPMDLASGIGIQLHGSAELVGSDTASVSYVPVGATNSVTN